MAAENTAGGGARFLLSGATNNPHRSWYDYFGLPDDLAEWTIDDVRSTVVSIAPSMLAGAGSGAAGGANGTFASSPDLLRRTITLADFERYLRTVGEPYRFLAANRPADALSGDKLCSPDECALAPAASRTGADRGGEAPGGGHLASADAAARLAAVPPVVFDQRFELTDPATFGVFSPEGAPAATMVMIERLANYLDQVFILIIQEYDQNTYIQLII